MNPLDEYLNELDKQDRDDPYRDLPEESEE